MTKLSLYLQRTLIVAALSLIAGCGRGMDDPADKPNIIFILIDDMGYGDLNLTGNERVATPNMDRLAANGLLQESFYVASPICSPSRVALFTGHYPSRYQIHSFIHTRAHNRRRGMADYLPPDTFTLADLTKQAGYATAHIGKWHMGGGRDVGNAPLPMEYGFDESYVSFEGLGDRLLFSDQKNKLSHQSAELGRGNIDWRPKHQATQIYVDKAIDFVDRHKTQPFYLQLWLNDVHVPHMPSESMLASRNDDDLPLSHKKFNAVIANMDKQLGRLFDHLQSQGLIENTLILLTSDNGPASNERYYQNGEAPPGSTAGLRGRKLSLYEGGIRMPLLVQWPGKVSAGKRDDVTLITAVDFLPTIAALLGRSHPQSDGLSLLSSWLDSPVVSRESAILWEFGSTGDPDAHPRPHLVAERSPKLAIRDNRWKLLINPDGTGAELYDIENDPQEAEDLSAQYVEVTERLSKQVRAWRAEFKE